jgi:hypothetical protein
MESLGGGAPESLLRGRTRSKDAGLAAALLSEWENDERLPVMRW